jgi:predicted nicotinamide N-methyase
MAFEYAHAHTVLHVEAHTLHARWARSFVRQEGETRPLPFGATLWPSALALLHAMVRLDQAWEGTRVLEVGCGVGMGSVLAARLGARATAADNHGDMAAFLLENARLNAVHVDWLHWDHAVDSNATDAVDVLLGSDLLYSAGQLHAVLNTVERVVSRGNVVLLADPGRRSLWTLVEKLQARGYQVAHQPLSVDGTLFPGASDVMACHPAPTGPCHIVHVRR